MFNTGLAFCNIYFMLFPFVVYTGVLIGTFNFSVGSLAIFIGLAADSLNFFGIGLVFYLINFYSVGSYIIITHDSTKLLPLSYSFSIYSLEDRWRCLLRTYFDALTYNF